MSKKPLSSEHQELRAPRIGAIIGPHDPFWVQVREAVFRRAQQIGIALVPIELSVSTASLFKMDPSSLAEELLAQELDSIVSQTLPVTTIYQVVSNNVAIVYLGETPFQHKLLCSPTGLYHAARMAAEHIAAKLSGKGRVLCVGGMLDYGEDKGVTRITGFCDTLKQYPDISVLHCPSAWNYEQAYPLAYSALRELGAPIHAIFGLSDSLALAARDAGQAQGLITPQTVIVGINGDPLALAAILDGSFSATVETSAEDLGQTAVDLALQAARGNPLPRNYGHTIRMITRENVAEHAVNKLVAIAKMPSYLVGVNREEERHRLLQLETSTAINHRVGSLLNKGHLSREVADLIRMNYGFDSVQYFRWSQPEQMLYLVGQDTEKESPGLPISKAGLLGEAIRLGEAIHIPDTRYHNRFPPEPAWPETRSRVVLPIRLGEETLGVLDLHCRQPMINLRWEIGGLKLLADHFGIALRNAELYNEALQAREAAEQLNQLKSRLLANVSHELRAPLNVILGYSQSALTIPHLYGIDLPENLCQDLNYIYQSGKHLIRIINDLLDLSRAEIGELNVFPEAIAPQLFLQELFESFSHNPAHENTDVKWQLMLPERLPVLQADPVRLRQILINLLSNAGRYTTQGQIVLGADVEPPCLHIWISDSGPGIPVDQQERIFEPFVSGDFSARRQGGIGLGLSITRRLVALHHGTMTLESQTGVGSTFHVYLPLPNLKGNFPPPTITGEHPAIVFVAPPGTFPVTKSIEQIAERGKLRICKLQRMGDLEGILQEVQPVAVALDTTGSFTGNWSLMQQIRRHPLLAALPLILFSEDPDVQETAGITNIVTKPFEGKRLVEMIDSLVGRGVSGPILIVDDDPQAREMYSRLVACALPGSVILQAEDGSRALSILDEDVPALVILDLIMPEVDGFQVLQSIRGNIRTSQVPVFILSGKQLTYEDVRRLDYSGLTVHTKGVLDPDEIVLAIQHLVNPGAKLSRPTSLLVKQALVYLHQNYGLAFSRAELAEAIGVSENYLTQIFRQELGLSPLECLNRLRIQKARELLRFTSEPVSAIAEQVGFDDPAYFSRVFRKISGCSPQKYRAGEA
jgi:signal transduction histidine kinase/AraC-like DNA-binding protein/ABC-type sugar transport system substrate-binding protein